MQASEDALALLAMMVALDPGRRISVEDDLAHPYFRCSTLATLLWRSSCSGAAFVGAHFRSHLQGRAQADAARAAA